MRRLAVVLLVLLLPGCGSTPSPPVAGTPLERFWAVQALGLIEGLDDALPRIARAGVGPGTLRDTSHLYEALLGYTFIDSCGEQLAHLGPPSAREVEANRLLHTACTHLRHAAALFTTAVKQTRAQLLVDAASEALGTATLLRRARAALAQIP